MNKMSFQSARKKLVFFWLLSSMVIFIIFFLQSAMGKYTEHLKEVWQWLSQYITPSLTLMVGVLIAQNQLTGPDKETDIFYFRLTWWISFFYLAILFLSPFFVPIIHMQQNQDLSIDAQKSIMDAFKTYDNFLMPIQAVAMLSLGLFFTKNN
jgi:hypothetical protein